MRVGALHETIPSRSETQNAALGAVADDRAATRLELVRPGVTTAATLAHERTLPVVAALHDLIPSGVLQRGSTLAAHGTGATSFGLAITAEAVRAGSFLAIVAPRSFGLGTCLDFDIPLRRVVQFALSEGSSGETTNWASQLAAIIEGFDLVVVADRHRVTASQARQLVARTRERGSVIVRVGGPSWPEAPDLRFDLGQPEWSGLGQGHGHLRARTLAVQVAGRRWHGSNRVRHVRLSTGSGGIELIEPPSALRFSGSDIDELLDVAESGDRSTRPIAGDNAPRPGPGNDDDRAVFETVA